MKWITLNNVKPYQNPSNSIYKSSPKYRSLIGKLDHMVGFSLDLEKKNSYG